MHRTAWSNATTEWLAWLRAGGTPETTLTTRTYQLRRVATELADTHPWSVTDQQITEWLAGHGWALETLRSHRSAVRSFYGWAHSHGHIDTDPTRLLRKIPHSRARPRPAAERVIADAIARADERQQLMLILGARHGLRRGEIARVHTDDLIDDLAGSSLLVHGKGGKDRVVPLLDQAADLIRRRPRGWVFPNGRDSHITPGHVGVILSQVMSGATPHQLRHRFATTAYSRTHDLRAVQELLGHASVATTETYTAVPDESLRAAVLAAAA